ncbi:hypothetical protein GCM10029992_38310 [Glycomyces albus]
MDRIAIFWRVDDDDKHGDTVDHDILRRPSDPVADERLHAFGQSCWIDRVHTVELARFNTDEQVGVAFEPIQGILRHPIRESDDLACDLMADDLVLLQVER